ncbi:MAG: ATP-dependent RNA helicase HrpA [Thermodesulfobacteriota bacterium]
MGKRLDKHIKPGPKTIDDLLKAAMHADRIDALRTLKRIKQLRRSKGKQNQIASLLTGVENRLKRSRQKRDRRKSHVPKITYDPGLPITARKDDIITAIKDHPVVIISGETGSGKTTQIPKFCLAAGRGIDGMIGCTQPRRIAATTVSNRIAEELSVNLGEAVGYKIRFKEKTNQDTFIKIMTDGILLAETQNDPYLNAYDTIIVDEAHERSLNIDFVLGILKGLLSRRKGLKLIITSATIDTEKFSKAFDNAPIIEVSGRMFPVKTEYLALGSPDPKARENDSDADHIEAAAAAVNRLQNRGGRGDILVFMPTEQDIRECCGLISGKKYPHTTVLPLFARLSSQEQKKVFQGFAGRKIIVATNVAETSITIPGIKYVVDTGLARMSRYNPRYRITALPIVPVSRSSADQRKGRCGRVENGVCIRLYTEEDYLNRSLFTKPEILRSNLAEVILRMIHLGLGDIAVFPFIDRPADKSIKDGFRLLLELGAIRQIQPSPDQGHKTPRPRRRQTRKGAYALTAVGRLMAKLPLDPRLSKMIIEAHQRGCHKEIIVIAAALSVQDPRERPAEKKQAAHEAQAVFTDPQSDFITLLNLWKRYNSSAGSRRSAAKLKKYCKAHYLSFRRMREWIDIHHQITLILKENGLGDNKPGGAVKQPPRKTDQEKTRPDATFPEGYAAIHKSILSGFLSNIAQQKEKQFFKGAREREVMVFPGSGLFKHPGAWIVAAEFVETSRLFARIVANIDVDWLEALGGDQCRRTHRDPHWEKNRGEVVATEQVSLYGLLIVPGRPVSYGPIDPEEATDIFIQQALVTGEVKTPFKFLKFNQGLIDEIRNMEDKIRRRDILVHEEEMAAFYSQRLPLVYDTRTLKHLIRKKGTDDFLKLDRDDLLRYTPDSDAINLFPDKVHLGNKAFEALYQFDPGQQSDGLTVRIPSSDTAGVDRTRLDWLVPGMLKEKITALIKSLPKEYRKRLVPVTATVDIVLQEMDQNKAPLIIALGSFIHDRFNVDIPASAWLLGDLPDHLKMRLEIVDSRKKVLHQGRDSALLDGSLPAHMATREFEQLKQKWEHTGIEAWDFGDIPEMVTLKGKKGAEWTAYPGLEKDGNRVNLRLFKDEGEARSSHPNGVAALFARKFAPDLKFLKQNLMLPARTDQAARYFGGRKKVDQRIYDDAVDRLFSLDIRKQADYLQQEEQFATKGIHTRGNEKMQKIMAALEANQEARTTIHSLETANPGKVKILQFLEELRADLTDLLPETFVKLYDTARLTHLPRYIKASAVRGQRGVVDLEKDRQRSKDVNTLNLTLRTLIQNLSDGASTEKRTAVEDLFWLIQEYKVSVYAQELKTAVPVSLKTLKKKIKEIQRMI